LNWRRRRSGSGRCGCDGVRRRVGAWRGHSDRTCGGGRIRGVRRRCSG
jgi:hypothetical protein